MTNFRPKVEILEDRLTPSNDPIPLYGFNYKYGANISKAWNQLGTGSYKQIVGLSDTGVDYTHKDLYLNIWLNDKEIPKTANVVDVDRDKDITFYDLNARANKNKVADVDNDKLITGKDVLAAWSDKTDGDRNGYIDDLIGWNFVENNNDPYDLDEYGHGTHVAGTIGAIGNNRLGVAGVNWKVSIIPLRMLGENGNNLTNAAQAFNYASKIPKLKVINASWGAYALGWNGLGEGWDKSLYNLRNKKILLVVAAGNGSQNLDKVFFRSFPAQVPMWNVIAVGSMSANRRMSSFSDYGETQVDILAPGDKIYSTVPGNKYRAFRGTSMAAPHVTGSIALILSKYDRLATYDIKKILISTAVKYPWLDDLSVSDGRLDLYAASQRLGVNMSKLRPLNKTVVVIPVEPVGKSPGGIVIPETAQTQQGRGRVLAAHSEAKVNKGELVVYSSYAGVEVEVDGNKYRLIADQDLLAVIE